MKLGIRFQDDVILIHLRVHRIDLALAERVIESAVDRLRCDSKARRGNAVDHQRFRYAAQLLIRRDIGEFRKLREFCGEVVHDIV